MNKLLAILLSLFSIFALTACTISENTPVLNQSARSGDVIDASPLPNNYIAKEAALNIALQDAGVNESEIRALEIVLDRDEHIPHYDVEFKLGKIEYNYDVNAETGAILEKDRDYDD